MLAPGVCHFPSAITVGAASRSDETNNGVGKREQPLKPGIPPHHMRQYQEFYSPADVVGAWGYSNIGNPLTFLILLPFRRKTMRW